MSSEAQPSFACDYSLFRFAKVLRLLGADVFCSSEALTTTRLISNSEAEKRILIVSVGKMIPLVTRREGSICLADLSNGRAFSTTEFSSSSSNHHKKKIERQQRQILQEEAAAADIVIKDEEEIVKTKWHFPDSESNRRRRITGYNSDGESEYEYEKEKEHLVRARHRQRAAAAAASVVAVAAAAADGSDTTSEEIIRTSAAVEIPPPLRYIVIDLNQSSSSSQQQQQQFKHLLMEIIRASNVRYEPSLLFSRCITDNGLIVPVEDKEKIRGLVSESIYNIYNNFLTCTTCSRIFWGVDRTSQCCMNYKSAYTADFLQSLFFESCASVSSAGGGAAADTTTRLSSSLACAVAITPTVIVPPPRLQRRIFSFSRKMKYLLFSFLENSDLLSLSLACPMMAELIVNNSVSSSVSSQNKNKNNKKIRGNLRVNNNNAASHVVIVATEAPPRAVI